MTASSRLAGWLSASRSQEYGACFTNRPPVFTSRCCKLVSAQLSILFGSIGHPRRLHFHIRDLVQKKRASGGTWFEFVTGPESMLFNKRDLREAIDSFKWFLGKGPRPAYGRWTYWGKFDYFTVFWGVAVIGTTGLLLWFPTLFTRIMPGWMLNVATTIHSDEALLAVGFTFTVHFFNTHFRPEKFPMDTVIFTEGVPLEEFKRDRPREYQELLDSSKLEDYLMEPPVPLALKFWRRLGFTALTIGLLLIALILYAEIIAYK